MNAPHLNRALVLEGVVRAPDGAGGFTEAWGSWARFGPRCCPGPAATRWAKSGCCRRCLTGSPCGARRPGSASRPKAGQRFREGTRLFLIQAVTERDPPGRYLTCFAREEVPK